MTEKGETNNYTLSDHIRAIFEHSGGAVFDFCICDTGEIIPEYIRLYHTKGSEVVEVDNERLKMLGIKIMKRDLSRVVNEKIRHDPDTVALTLMEIIFSEIKYTEQRDEVKYTLLNQVLREQRKIQKRIDRNIKKTRRRKEKEEKNKDKQNNKNKIKDKDKIKEKDNNKKNKKELEDIKRGKTRSIQKENLEKIQVDENLEERPQSKFLEKYRDRIESVRNADLIREENLKKLQADEEEKRKKAEQKQVQDEIKEEAEELFKQIKKLERNRQQLRKDNRKDNK